ncbi:MAG TPA: hypothetical protein VFN03_03660, partial [Trueperaceae bacterium]|nr:hypothetical protein [Trueperaceae bacterium]
MTQDDVAARAGAAGVEVPGVLAAGVAARLQSVATAVERWRPAMGETEPFGGFDLRRPTTTVAVRSPRDRAQGPRV